jgi:4,4'-diaponeurosporenoate glycosyltransferase
MIALILFGWIAGWLLFVGLRRCSAWADDRSRAGEISIIIPARDEEENLPRLLQSIARQTVAPREVVVVNDCSRDQTAAIAEAWSTTVIDGSPPPADWRGKTWACQQGAEVASGATLLFLDADTWLEHDALSCIAEQLNAGAISIAPYHCVPTLREQFSAFFHLIMLGGAGSQNLLGQSLLIDRATYSKVGGHRAVRQNVLENFALAEKLRPATSVRSGRGVLNIRMYPHSWRELSDGWSKGFAMGAAQTSTLRLALIIVWLGSCILAVNHFATYALIAFQIALLLRRIGNYNLLTALFYPLPLLYFFAVFARSILRGSTRSTIVWKGRPLRAA